MKGNSWRLIALAALALVLDRAVLAQNTAACQRVQFSDEVLNRFPKAPQACLDVITRDGQDYAVFKAQLERVTGNTLRVRIKQPDGTYAPPTNIETSPGRRILIDGRPVPVSELAPDQELTAYVRVDKPMIALPPAVESDPIEATPMAAEEPMVARAEPAMPHTAGPMELVVLLISSLYALAAALRFARTREDD